MLRVHVAHRFDSPAERVWEVMGPFGGVLRYAGGLLRAVETKGEGVGCIRILHGADLWKGARVVERLEAWDPIEFVSEYRMLDAAGLPYTDFIGGFRLTRAGPGACSIHYWSRFVALGVDDADAVEFSRASIRQAIANVARVLVDDATEPSDHAVGE